MKFIKKINISSTLIILGLVFILWDLFPYVYEEARYFYVSKIKNGSILVADAPTSDSIKSGNSIFAGIMSKDPLVINPVNREFSLVIEKIGLNVPVIRGVSVTKEDEYIEALRSGVAQALISDLPSDQPGNTYIFAHASLNFWKLGKYATSFNLLRKLEVGDSVNVFYHGKRYQYSVVNKEIVQGWNTYPLTRPVIEPLLTLQTCDPPGTTLNRLIVTAKLQKVY